jgi:hypothetical protein
MPTAVLASPHTTQQKMHTHEPIRRPRYLPVLHECSHWQTCWQLGWMNSKNRRILARSHDLHSMQLITYSPALRVSRMGFRAFADTGLVGPAFSDGLRVRVGLRVPSFLATCMVVACGCVSTWGMSGGQGVGCVARDLVPFC